MKQFIRSKFILSFGILVFTLLLNVCHAQEFVSMEFLLNYDRQTIINDFGVPATNGVDLFKIRYTSTDLEGMPDTLSGLVAIPDTENLEHPVLIYGHGTVGSRESVPSRLSGEHVIVTIFGSLGYFTLAPDYLGLGDSDGVHPYVHAESEAWASYDMLKSIRTSVEENGFLINDQNFIFGYSQGGHTAMALQRYMETINPDGFEVTASAPSSGPYSISGEMKEKTLSDDEYFFVAYLAYVAISYEAAYGNILGEDGLYSFFKKEYADEIEKFRREEIDLFDLNDTLIDLLIANHGSSVPKFMILESRLDELLNDPQSNINLALKDNDVYDWSPKAPTRLFYCMSDDQVIYTNSILADSVMNANGGVDVGSLDVGSSLTHTQCVPNAITLTIFFFDGYKQVTTNTKSVASGHYFSIGPNPATDHIFIDREGFNNVDGMLTIYGMNGNILKREKATTGDPIDVSNLPSGQYLILWETDQSTEVHRIVLID